MARKLKGLVWYCLQDKLHFQKTAVSLFPDDATDTLSRAIGRQRIRTLIKNLKNMSNSIPSTALSPFACREVGNRTPHGAKSYHQATHSYYSRCRTAATFAGWRCLVI